MAKEKEQERKMFVGIVWNCAAELKYLLMALLILCSIATILQFFPSHLSVAASDLRLCLSQLSSDSLTPPISSSSPFSSSSPPPLSSLPPSPSFHERLSVKKEEEIVNEGIIKRAFNPYGTAAYAFIQMGAYRAGSNTFAIIGLASKPLHVYAKPQFQCEWIPFPNGINESAITVGYKILPDWGYGRVYTVVVVNCTFPVAVGTDGSGGRLVLHASTAGGGDRDVNSTEKIEALREAPGSFNGSIFTSPPRYDYLYCGSSLYGNLSPQRVREWIAYHVKLFGEKSHFIIHDAGGVHTGVLEVLKPWIEKGFVTLQEIREQERFDGYYHNQFLVVNDCLHRYRFMAKWMFFFDVDEYFYVPRKNTIKSVLDSLSEYTQFTIEQMPMSNKFCLTEDAGKFFRKWGFEKLVYRDVKTGIRRDRKYAIQPRKVFATGVHMSQNVEGKTSHKTEGRIKYFHYHGTIASRREPCRKFVNTTGVKDDDGTPYILDKTLRDVAATVKKFELKVIGSTLQRTRQ